MYITKADGTTEQFRPEKLLRSLIRSGASRKEAERVTAHVVSEIEEGMQTSDIYRHAFSDLKKDVTTPTAARYSVRRALFGLGPTGFPFEEFLARLFQKEGYKTKVGSIISGKCATHEIDLAAYKDDHSFVAEAKFHAKPSIKSDLHVALYSYARMLDLSEQRICSADICGIKNLYLITNTKFTSAAVRYANCTGVTLLGWDYPKKGNLYDLIQKHKLYPITVLQTLSASEKRRFLDEKVITCEEFIAKASKYRNIIPSENKLERAIQEAKKITA